MRPSKLPSINAPPPAVERVQTDAMQFSAVGTVAVNSWVAIVSYYQHFTYPPTDTTVSCFKIQC